MGNDERVIVEVNPTKADLDGAKRLPELFAFFEARSVQELLQDQHWLSQYIIFRHHQEFQKVIDGIQKRL